MRARQTLNVALATALAGTLGVALLGFIANSDIRQWVAGLSMISVAGAVVAGTLGVRTARRDQAPIVGTDRRARRGRSLGIQFSAPILAAAAAQTWFTWGRSLAGGDIAPPEGTAWIGHLFSAWSWTGSNLGAPNASEIDLPWAGVLALTHALGVPAWMAQRLWLTVLFAAVAASAVLLLRTLGLGSVSSFAGALMYGFNAYVVSTVGVNDVYLAAMILLAAYPALVLRAASRRLSDRWAVALLAALSPMLGFAYANPPLAFMVAIATLAMFPLAGWLWGKQAALTALRVLTFGGAAALLVSAYWIVPALVQTSIAATSSLGAVSSWAWTEGRANLANGLWLNTAWGWISRIYYPYSGSYDQMPLVVVKFFPPFLAFSGLTGSVVGFRRGQRPEKLRLALAAASVALVLIFFGTGTTPPGSVLFDPIYSLPLGFLLREPGRFLMAASLCYGVLTGIAVECAQPLLADCLGKAANRSLALAVTSPLGRVGSAAALAAVLVVVLAPAYPLALGQVAPSRPRGTLPPSRVTFPSYWTAMSHYLNAKAPPGAVLVLPPDDFYQMPYSWGYYGNDGFITNLLSRNVLDPSPQGYDRVSSEVVQTDAQVSQSILNRRWALLTQLLTALATPLILVRGDVISSFPGRDIMSPAALASSLVSDPDARLLYQTGPLDLFDVAKVRSSSIARTQRIATVNTTAPNLEGLSLLPPGTSLVTAPMQSGLPAEIQAPPEATWFLNGKTLAVNLPAPVGWRYRVFALSPGGTVLTSASVTGRNLGTEYQLTTSVGRQELVDGVLGSGPWQRQVGNCNDVGGHYVGAALRSTVLPHAGPTGEAALRLSASTDSACEATPIRWTSGSLLLSIWVRHVSGAPPRLCLWESAFGRCSAQTPVLSSSHSWRHVQAVITPRSGAGQLTLFVYADSLFAGQYTANEYSDAAAYAVASVGVAGLVAAPATPVSSRLALVLSASSYSGAWRASGGEHVLVDGMRNGWLLPFGDAGKIYPYFAPAESAMWADFVSLLTATALAGLLWGLHVKGASGATGRNGVRKADRYG